MRERDQAGKLTPNAFVTGRLVTLQRVEVQFLAGYLEGGGLNGSNLDMINEIDRSTRGGRDPFFWALDANVKPEAWDSYCVGKDTWLERWDAKAFWFPTRI